MERIKIFTHLYVQNANIRFKSVNKCVKSWSENYYILFYTNEYVFKIEYKNKQSLLYKDWIYIIYTKE